MNAESESTFLRPRDGRMVAGVCAGVARHFGLDAVVVRVLAVVLGLLVVGLVAYLLLYFVMEEE